VDIVSSPNVLHCINAIFGMLNVPTPENSVDRVRVSEWWESMVPVARRNNDKLFHMLLNYFYKEKLTQNLDNLILVMSGQHK
jgi:hypothetical protein